MHINSFCGPPRKLKKLLRNTKEPILLSTANGLLAVDREFDFEVLRLSMTATALYIPDSPAVLSIGKLVKDNGFEMYWILGHDPYFIGPDNTVYWLQEEHNCLTSAQIRQRRRSSNLHAGLECCPLRVISAAPAVARTSPSVLPRERALDWRSPAGVSRGWSPSQKVGLRKGIRRVPHQETACALQRVEVDSASNAARADELVLCRVPEGKEDEGTGSIGFPPRR